MLIEVARERAIYALIKNCTFVNFTLFIKRYPFQPINAIKTSSCLSACSVNTFSTYLQKYERQVGDRPLAIGSIRGINLAEI